MFTITNNAKYRSTVVAVVVGLLLVLWQLFVNPLSQAFRLSFFAISLFAFGIQHGALDHLIEAEIARRKQTSFRIVTFLAKYGMLMLIYALLWYLFPQISFLFFILMSGWHFGETDVSGNNKSLLAAFAKLLYGVSVIGWILFSHPHEAGDIISHIVPAQEFIYQSWLVAANDSNGILIACGIIIITMLFTSGMTNKSPQNIGLFINLLLILSCCAELPLLPSFALYFAGWHSVITLHNITVFTEKENRNGKPLRFGKLWLKALPLSAIAIAGLLFTGYLLQHHAPLFEPLPLLFVFLSLITLPHMSVMHQLNKRLFT